MAAAATLLSALPLFAALCPLHSQAIPQPAAANTRKLTLEIKQAADAVRDKRATVDSVAAPIGPWKLDEFGQCELMPRDPQFREGRIDVDRYYHNLHTPQGKQPIEGLELTLAKGIELTPHALERVFGKWRTIPGNPEGNPYQIAYASYPNANARLSVAVFAELTGPAHSKKTCILSLSFRRDDWDQATRDAQKK